MLLRKYATHPIDLIIAASSRSLRVASTTGRTSSRARPVVFVAVDPKAAADLRLDAEVTGTWLHVVWMGGSTWRGDSGRHATGDRDRGGVPHRSGLAGSSPQQLGPRAGSVEVEYLAGLALEES